MANASTGNMYFIDTAPLSINVKQSKIAGILVHCTHASSSAVIVLADNNSGTSYPTIISFEVAAANEFEYISFPTPLVFPNGIRVKTLTDATITLVLEKGE